MTAIQFTTAQTDAQLEQILELQSQNVEAALSSATAREQGFVSLRHDLALLREMNEAEPHVIALDGQRVVGYALAMLPRFGVHFAELDPMFRKLAQFTLGGETIASRPFLILGQVCVAQSHRGTGVFRGLYEHMRALYGDKYDALCTEIASRNRHSAAAHAAVGFQLIERYEVDDGSWDLVAWDWRAARAER